MIWLSWRQLRVQVLSVAAIVLVFVTALALTWSQVSDLARDTDFTGCQADACAAAADTFINALAGQPAGILNYIGLGVALLLPLLLGTFWGAPLIARELETGTYRMIFTQSVSRQRWLLAKLAIGGGASAVCAGVVSLVLTPWSALIDQAGTSRVSPIIFATRGIVPVASAVLGFVVGVVVGQILRRTVTAMAVTLLVGAALQLAVPSLLLNALAQPTTTVTALDVTTKFSLIVEPGTNKVTFSGGTDIPGSWVLSRSIVTSSGAEYKGPLDSTKCPVDNPGPPSDECRQWLATQNLGQKTTYVPGSRFWALQWSVFAGLTILTLGLCLLSSWWIRRRLV
jgi:ABC-type transport system involved in multi-copper enzyme maturation permease subunit